MRYFVTVPHRATGKYVTEADSPESAIRNVRQFIYGKPFDEPSIDLSNTDFSHYTDPEQKESAWWSVEAEE